jgi:hypothetical protein
VQANHVELKNPKGTKYMNTEAIRSARTISAIICLLAISTTLPAALMADPLHEDKDNKNVEHVLLISVDGLHQSDLAWYVQTHPQSNLAALTGRGVDYSNASTPFPSDSFPGMVGPATGGNPATTGIYYDDTWNHDVFPAGTLNCKGKAPGGEVTYFEALDLNLGAPRRGAGHSASPGRESLGQHPENDQQSPGCDQSGATAR